MKAFFQSAPLWLITLGVCALLYAANLLLGNLNQDEGWYLYTAGLVAEGQLPFRDFAYTQGPIMAAVYAVANPIIERFGVAGGRALTVCFALCALFLSAACAKRLAPSGWRTAATLLCVILLGINVYHSYYTTVVKTYALYDHPHAGVLLFYSGGKLG